MAQFYLWYPIVPPPPVYTKPRDRTRRHARSKSVASSSAQDSSLTSRRSTSPTSSISSASASSSLTRSSTGDGNSSRGRGRGSSDNREQLLHPPSAAGSEKQKLRKKQPPRRGNNPSRHARSSSADSAVLVTTPLTPTPAADGLFRHGQHPASAVDPASTSLARTTSTHGRLSARLFHRSQVPRAALQPASEPGLTDSSSLSSANSCASVQSASRKSAAPCCAACCPSVHRDSLPASAASTPASLTFATSAPTAAVPAAVPTVLRHSSIHYYHLAGFPGPADSSSSSSSRSSRNSSTTPRAPAPTNRHLDPAFRHSTTTTTTTRRSKSGRPAAAAPPAITISDYPTPTLGLPACEPKNAPLYLDTDGERIARMNAIYTTRPESLSSGTTAVSSTLGRHCSHNHNHHHNHCHNHNHNPNPKHNHSHSHSHNLHRIMAAPSEPPDTIATKPFAPLNGRAYLNDPKIPYPLPVDLAELHRQSLRTLLLIQVFGAPACSPAYAARPPARVLEIGCGSGFWSMMCHRYFRELGHGDISFTGLDIAPLAPGALPGGRDDAKPDADMDWRFVRHDLRQTPFPFPDADFDLVMVKDMSLAVTHASQQSLVDEYLRVLRPGGHLEIWDSDHTIRMLRPHALDLVSPHPSSSASIASTSTTSSTFSSASTAAAGVGSGWGWGWGGGGAAGPPDQEDEHRAAAALGAYVVTSNTPLSPPLNNYLVEYNGWLSRALELRDVTPVPCTLIGPLLHQESECLTDVRSRRLAIPLSDVRWEKEGVGGVVTKDGKSYIDTRGRKGGAAGGSGDDGAGGGGGGGGTGAGAGKEGLGPGQAALRRTALEVVVQGIQGMEPMLREASGKRADEWDAWIGKMAGDLLAEGGTAWGECLEVGAWWAQKR